MVIAHLMLGALCPGHLTKACELDAAVLSSLIQGLGVIWWVPHKDSHS